jgi:hypothetical protein
VEIASNENDCICLVHPEGERSTVTSCRETTTVDVMGSYPDGNYGYTYPGAKAAGIYVRKGTRRWFCGASVAGDGLELSADDRRWMKKEEVFFRIKAGKGADGELRVQVYYIEFPEVKILDT